MPLTANEGRNDVRIVATPRRALRVEKSPSCHTVATTAISPTPPSSWEARLSLETIKQDASDASFPGLIFCHQPTLIIVHLQSRVTHLAFLHLIRSKLKMDSAAASKITRGALEYDIPQHPQVSRISLTAVVTTAPSSTIPKMLPPGSLCLFYSAFRSSLSQDSKGRPTVSELF